MRTLQTMTNSPTIKKTVFVHGIDNSVILIRKIEDRTRMLIDSSDALSPSILTVFSITFNFTDHLFGTGLTKGPVGYACAAAVNDKKVKLFSSANVSKASILFKNTRRSSSFRMKGLLPGSNELE